MLATIHTGYGGLDRHAMKLQRFRGDSVYYTIYQQSGGGGGAESPSADECDFN